MNGIAAVQARMAAVQARFDAASAALRAPGAEPLGATGEPGAAGLPLDLAAAGGASGEFATLLAGALGQLPGAPAIGAGGRPAGGVTGGPPSAVGAVGAHLGRATALPPGAAPGGGIGGLAAERKAPGQYGRLQPPAELVAFGNGRIPADALASIGVGGHRLWAPAARAYRAMVADAQAAGVKIGITDSYRDYDTQVSLARRKGLYSQGGLAATPGTSNHGWGMAVDLDLDATAQQWMRDNGWRYGFVEDTPREPWHWGFRPAGGTASVA